MPYIYFDESHRPLGGFCLGAFVVLEQDPTEAVRTALSSAGLVPGKDEYKSRNNHSQDPRYLELRESLFRILTWGSVGVMVIPYSERATLGREALSALAYMTRENELGAGCVYFDQGLFRSISEARSRAVDAGVEDAFELHFEHNSVTTYGIQLADLVAHTTSVMLMAQLGCIAKTVKAGPNSGYDEDLDLPLEFELWSRLRYHFMSRSLTEPEHAAAAEAGVVDTRGALYISTSCSATLADSARARFAHMYLGCIH